MVVVKKPGKAKSIRKDVFEVAKALRDSDPAKYRGTRAKVGASVKEAWQLVKDAHPGYFSAEKKAARKQYAKSHAKSSKLKRKRVARAVANLRSFYH